MVILIPLGSYEVFKTTAFSHFGFVSPESDKDKTITPLNASPAIFDKYNNYYSNLTSALPNRNDFEFRAPIEQLWCDWRVFSWHQAVLVSLSNVFSWKIQH